jgi:hypothetical protein
VFDVLQRKKNYQEKLHKVLSLKRERAAASNGLDIRHADRLKNFSKFSSIIHFSFLASVFGRKRFTFSGGCTVAKCQRRLVTFAISVRSRPDWSCRFLRVRDTSKPAPKYIVNIIKFLGDLQHFLDHGDECDFSEVFSTCNVRKHLVPANGFKKFRSRVRKSSISRILGRKNRGEFEEWAERVHALYNELQICVSFYSIATLAVPMSKKYNVVPIDPFLIMVAPLAKYRTCEALGMSYFATRKYASTQSQQRHCSVSPSCN